MSNEGSARSFLIPLSSFLLLAALLRLYRIDGQSLWYDEGVSAFMTTRGPMEIARAAAADIHPPLYYWLLSAWAAPFGNGESSLRGLSVLFGTTTVWVVWRLGRELFDEAVGLSAAGLLAISPLAIQYSQEVRMYALAALLATSSTWAYLAFTRSNPPRGRLAILYGLLAAALLYTHYYGVLVLGVHQLHLALTLAIHGRWRLLRPWLLGTALTAVLYVPWLPYALRQTGYYPGLGTPQPPYALALDAVNVLSIGVATTRFSFRLGLLPFLALAAIGLATRPHDGARVRIADTAAEPRPWGRAPRFPAPGARALLALWTVLPIGTIIVLSTSRPLYEPRFLMLVLPAWVILVAAGGVTLGRSVSRLLFAQPAPRGPAARGAIAGLLAVVALGLLLLPTARSLAAYYFDPTYARDDYRGLASTIQALERPDDAVVLTAPGQAEIFDYYYRGRADQFPLPTQRPIDAADTLARLESLAAGHRRVWLVRWASQEADPDDLISHWLEAHTRTAGVQRFGRVELRLYELTATA